MGRWAQRSRSGGGPPAPAALIYIASASNDGFTEVRLRYSAAVDSDDFASIDFELTPGASNPILIAQGDPDELVLTFGDSSGATSITYNGGFPGLLSPQTVDF